MKRSEITFADNSLFAKSITRLNLNANIIGIRKIVITEACIFVLDNSGKVHAWDEDEDWKYNVLKGNDSKYNIFLFWTPKG